MKLTIHLSKQSKAVLDGLAELGVYGRDAEEVALRFVDKALQAFVDAPRWRDSKNYRKVEGT